MNAICCQSLCQMPQISKLLFCMELVTILGKLIIKLIHVTSSHFAEIFVFFLFNRYPLRIIIINLKYSKYTCTQIQGHYIWLFVTSDVSLHHLYFGNANISSNFFLMHRKHSFLFRKRLWLNAINSIRLRNDLAFKGTHSLSCWILNYWRHYND